MAIDAKHPLYSQFRTDWQVMRDTYRGERVVKEATTLYLPATSGQTADGLSPGQPGYQAYQAYITRAVFHDFVSDAVEAAIGVMHHKPPTIELPAALEPMREKATINGESLEQLLRRINMEQLVTGRAGMLLDLPNAPTLGSVLPYIATYQAEHIINWDNGTRDVPVIQNLNLVVLEESEYERKTDLDWEYNNKYRILLLGDPTINEPAGGGTYSFAIVKDNKTAFNPAELIQPSIRGRVLEQIPFVFVNSKDIVPDPDDPPLIGLAKLALAIYRLEADYRQSLFMQGQDTLVVIGMASDSDEVRVGANASIKVPTGGDAKFIGVDSKGLPELRQALENDKNRALQKGGQMLDATSREKESGEALKVRVAAQAATLNHVALSGAEALQTILRIAAVWVGANPEEVIVTPNLDFVDEQMLGKELVDLMSARTLGAPISLETIHTIMQARGMTEMEFEDEIQKILDEEKLSLGGPGAEDEEDEDKPPPKE